MKVRHPSSFRDNSGFVYKKNNIYYRQINQLFREHYECLISSGLYDELVRTKQLIPHDEIFDGYLTNDGYKIILPSQLSFTNFSYCWSFSMLKDAALLTLNIQKTALKYGMILKDANSFNIQFVGNAPIFIDSLSFEKYEESFSWNAYGQFCRHFLAPLSLMCYTDISLNSLLISNLDGIPLDLATRILPFRSKFNIGLYVHLFLHNKSLKHFQNSTSHTAEKSIGKGNKNDIVKIVDHLISTIQGLTWKAENTTWDGYYNKWVGEEYLETKKNKVQMLLDKITSKNILLDLGANDGTFSFLASKSFKSVLSFDIDPACVEQNYLLSKRNKIQNLLPLIVDFTSPTPAIGWNNQERSSILDCIGQVDTVMALAVIHHLCIGKNIPLTHLATFFAKHCKFLIVEFVPKSDEKVKMLLQNREDIFDTYSLKMFIEIFSSHFDILHKITLSPTDRMLFLMSKKS